MLLPAWVSIATVGLWAWFRGRVLRHLCNTDINDAVSSDPTQYEHQEGNFGFHERLLHR